MKLESKSNHIHLFFKYLNNFSCQSTWNFVFIIFIIRLFNSKEDNNHTNKNGNYRVW